jgi:hypothetical protein
MQGEPRKRHPEHQQKPAAEAIRPQNHRQHATHNDENENDEGQN